MIVPFQSLGPVKRLPSAFDAKDDRKGSGVRGDRATASPRDEPRSASIVWESHGVRRDYLTHGNDSRLGGSCYLA